MSTSIEQYDNLKRKQGPQEILLMRMGDFLEALDEDAYAVSKILNLSVTRLRGSHRPIAGFPYSCRDQLVAELVKAGYRVHVVEPV